MFNNHVFRFKNGINTSDFDFICKHLYEKGPVDFGCSPDGFKRWGRNAQERFVHYAKHHHDLEVDPNMVIVKSYTTETGAGRLLVTWEQQINTNIEAKRYLDEVY